MGLLNKFVKAFGIIAFIFLSIVILKGISTPQEVKYDRYLKYIEKKEYNGMVLKKYRDKNRHNRSFLVFAGNREVPIKSKVYDEIKLKDSIVKREGELCLTVYRNNDIFIIKLD